MPIREEMLTQILEYCDKNTENNVSCQDCRLYGFCDKILCEHSLSDAEVIIIYNQMIKKKERKIMDFEKMDIQELSTIKSQIENILSQKINAEKIEHWEKVCNVLSDYIDKYGEIECRYWGGEFSIDKERITKSKNGETGILYIGY